MQQEKELPSISLSRMICFLTHVQMVRNQNHSHLGYVWIKDLVRQKDMEIEKLEDPFPFPFPLIQTQPQRNLNHFFPYLAYHSKPKRKKILTGVNNKKKMLKMLLHFPHINKFLALCVYPYPPLSRGLKYSISTTRRRHVA